VTRESDISQGHIFLSYAAEDRDVAGQLAAALSNRGELVWWDRLIDGGSLWAEEIDRALSQARVVVVLWSNASVVSSYVRAEARTAADRHILIPAMIEVCEPPMLLGNIRRST
jgi:hypothetical protein